MKIAQISLAAPAAPLRGKDDEVERMRRLDLEPRSSPPARLVGSVEGLGHDSLVATRQRLVEERPRRLLVVHDLSLDSHAAGHDARERVEALCLPAIQQLLAVQKQAIEEECRKRQLAAKSADL